MKKSLIFLTTAVIFTVILAACTAEIVTLPTAVMLDQSSFTIPPGESLSITAYVTPDEAANKTLLWSSSTLK